MVRNSLVNIISHILSLHRHNAAMMSEALIAKQLTTTPIHYTHYTITYFQQAQIIRGYCLI